MRLGRWISLRSFLAALLALGVCLGGGSVLLATSPGDAAAVRAADEEMRRVATVVSEKLNDSLTAVGRDTSLAAANSVFDRDGRISAVQQFLARWRGMHPDYADVLFADRSGRVLATASGSFVGSDVSGTTWFVRALSGLVIGDASERSRAGGDAPRNVIVGAPVGGAGAAAAGVLAVQLTPDWIDEAVAATRRILGGSARKSVVQVMNAGGRSIYRSGGAAADGDLREASAAIGDESGLGWLVLAKGSGRIEGDAASAFGSAPLIALALATLAAALLGWVLGARLGSGLARIRHAAAEDRAALLPGGATVSDVADLADAVGSCVGRSAGRERIQQETRAALARSRDRVRAVKLLGGFTCWEVDLRNGQVTWTDGSADMAESASERADDLDQVLSRIEATDRERLRQTMRAACEEPGSIREAVVRMLAGSQEAAGRRLQLRLTAVALNGHPVRLHILSREIGLIALPAPSTSMAVDTVTPIGGAAAPADARTQAIVAGLAHEIGEALSSVVAALDHESRAGDGRSGVATAHRHATRGTVLTRKLTALVRRDGSPAPEAGPSRILAETAELIRAAILPGLVVAPALADDLPALACTGRQLEVALLNLASDARESLPSGAAASLAVSTAGSASGDTQFGLRVVLAVPVAFQAERGVAAIRDLMEEIDGSIAIESTDGKTAITLFFPAAKASRSASTDDAGASHVPAILLVEPDPVMRAATAESLSRLGYAVTPAASAEEASAVLVGRRDFTLMLCAHTPPMMNGVLLAEVTSRTHPAIAIVLMATGEVSSRTSTAFGVLQKPFGSPDLARILDARTGSRRQAA